MIEPNGCRWCGVPRRRHAQQWVDAVGWHAHAEPTDAQRLARMRARREALADAVATAEAANVGRMITELTRRYDETVGRLKARVAELEDDERKLRALENAGVDNWSGYDYAMELLREYEREDGT